MSLRNSTAERRGQQNACVWQTWQGYYLRFVSWSSLKLMFSGLFQKHLFKGRWSLTEIVFEQNFCHACLARFAVFFPLPSCCVSLLLYTQWTRQWWHNTINLHEGTDCHSLQSKLFLSVFFNCSKFEFVPPPPGWSQHEMEAPFAIPPHLQGDVAQLEASYAGGLNTMFSFSPVTAPPPQIDLKAVTDYVST